MIVATASWFEALATPGWLPVRVSLGTPKGAVAPALEPAIPPYWLFRSGLPEADYRRNYRRLLHKRTPLVLRGLAELHREYLMPMALCCFEADPVSCHRWFLAEWLTEHDVEVVVR